MKRIAQAYPSLSAFEKKLELPMLFVTFAWLFVLIIELVYGTTAALSAFGTSIWVIFILYFGLRLTISGSRRSFLRKNWIVVLAILASVLRLIPFLQSFGGVRAVTATFGMQVVWIFASADQGMRSVRRALGRRGTGYALAFTFVVIFAGAAGMLHFEAGASANGHPYLSERHLVDRNADDQHRKRLLTCDKRWPRSLSWHICLCCGNVWLSDCPIRDISHRPGRKGSSNRKRRTESVTPGGEGGARSIAPADRGRSRAPLP
jgi:hypothetical protein